MLLAFGENDNAHAAFDALDAALTKGTTVRAKVGHRGGFVDSEVTWHPRVQMWSLLKPDVAEGRFWCCFGLDNPINMPNLDIAVEINPRHGATDLVVGGAFTKDERGVVHLCHNGKMGGGRKGVGKSAFFQHYSNKGGLEKMLYYDRLVDVVDLGPITSPRLPRRLAWFAGEVARIKAICAEGPDGRTGSHSTTKPAIPTFSPEFSGKRSAFSVRRRIEAKADHGLVVDALQAALERAGRSAYNDQARDLYILGKRDRVSVLFEVKTDVTTTSIYTAVGQLLLNGGAGPNAPKMVLVLPDKPKRKTAEALRSTGIEVLDFQWRGNKAVIQNSALKRVIG